MQKRLALFVFLLSSLASAQLRISQVYGGGGNGGATYTNDFIEIYNAGPTTINLSTYSVQYASSAGTTWSKTNLAGTILPNSYYLVQEAAGTGGTVALPTPDATGTIAMSATTGKVALVSNQTVLSGACPTGLVDFVGYGGTACFEGAGPTAVLTNTTAALRGGSGCFDTDSNSADFSATAPNPRNSIAGGTFACLPSSGSANPVSVPAGGSTNITATVTPGTNPASTGITVVCDFGLLGASQTLSLTNTSGNTYTGTVVVAPGTASANYFNACQSLDQELRGTAFTILITVTGGSTAPTGSGSATPNPVSALSSTTITANITPGTLPTSTGIAVTCNLSSIGGSASTSLAAAGGNQFSTSYNVPLSVAANTYSLPCSVTDDQSRSSNFSISLAVTNTSVNPSATGSANPNPITAGNSTTLSAVIAPGSNPSASTTNAACNLTSIGGTTGVALPVNFAVPAATAANTYSLPCTVSDDLGRSANFSISVTVQAAPPTLRKIYEITGSGRTSPLAGQAVTVQAVVTGLRASGSGFYIESLPADRDADDATSDGILVFTNGSNPACAAVGNLIQISGTVQDFVPSTAPLGSVPLTEISSVSSCTTISSGALASLPAPVTLTAANVAPGGLATQSRKYLGMRVTIPVATVVGASLGSLTESSATATNSGTYFATVQGVARPFRQPGIQDTRRPNDAAVTVPAYNGSPEAFRIDTTGLSGGTSNIEVAVGTTVTGIAGIMDFFTSQGQYQIYTDAAGAGTRSPASPTLAATPVPAPIATDLTVANFNIERFYNNVNDGNGNSTTLTATAYQGRLNKLSLAVRNVLRLPDIIVFEEVEGPRPSSPLVYPVIQDIVNQINGDAQAAGQGNPSYNWCQFPTNDPSLIDVAIIFKTGKVSLLDCIQYGATTSYAQPGGGNVTLNDRPPLVLRASAVLPGSDSGITLRVVGNHLRSLSGIDEPGATNGDRVRTKRNEQARYLGNLLTGNLPGEQTNNWNLTDNLIVSGDFNSYDVNDGFADVMNCIAGNPAPANQVYWTAAQSLAGTPCAAIPTLLLTNLTASDPAQRYSYSFSGVAQRIDHMLVNAKLLPRVRQFTYARNDADFPEGPTYRSDFARPERVSDHDPLVTYITLPMEVTSKTKLNATAFVLNRATQRYNTTVSVTNNGSATLNGPIYVFFNGLPSGVTIPGASTYNGVPYVTIAGPIAPGTTSASLTVGFANPSNVPIAYTSQRFDGTF